MIEELFRFRRANAEKLKQYGFAQTENGYRYETPVLDGQFKITVTVRRGEVSAEVTDQSTQEEYVLHLIESCAGEFVGQVRAEFINVLSDISDRCFEKEIFKSEQTGQAIDYIRMKYGDELEFLWESSPTSAVWRRKDNRKWYGVLLVIPKSKLGAESAEPVEIIDLRIDPDELNAVVDNERYFAGYHMNKKHWITICLDRSIPTETIFERIDQSYDLARKK